VCVQAKLDSLLKEDVEPQQHSNTQHQQLQQQQQQPSAAGVTDAARTFSSSHMRQSSAESEYNSDHPLAAFQPQQRRVLLLHSGEAVARMPGLGVYYSESSDGVPAVMKHVLGNMPALYSSMVFLTVRFVAVPTVTDEERFLAWRCVTHLVCMLLPDKWASLPVWWPRWQVLLWTVALACDVLYMANSILQYVPFIAAPALLALCRDKSLSGCYHAVVRYGYMDRVQHSAAFMEALVLTLLQQVLERKGIGSPGAAQRLLAALTAKAAAAGRVCAAGAEVEPSGDVQVCSRSDVAAAAVAVAALLEQFTSAELAEVLTPASELQKQQQKLQKVQQAQQQQEPQAWSIKARARLTQQQQQQSPSSYQPYAAEQAATTTAGETGEVLACIRLSDGGGTDGSAAKQATAAALLSAAKEISPAEAADAPAPSSSSAPVASLQNSSSFLSSLRQRVSFRLSRQDSGCNSSNQASQAAHVSAAQHAASREHGPADALGRPSYWGQLHKGYAADSDGESEVADEESAADLSAVVSGDGEECVNGEAGVNGTDSKLSLPQQQLTEEGAAAAGQLMGSSSSSADNPHPVCRVSGVTFEEAEQGAGAAADGDLSQAQLAALHEATQLMQAYQKR
jgi:hypothetical protein